jgi:hypothetical protein
LAADNKDANYRNQLSDFKIYAWSDIAWSVADNTRIKQVEVIDELMLYGACRRKIMVLWGLYFLYYCGFWPSGHFSKSIFVRWDLPRCVRLDLLCFVHLDLFGSKSLLKGTRELKIKAKFAIDTGQSHKKEILPKKLN